MKNILLVLCLSFLFSCSSDKFINIHLEGQREGTYNYIIYINDKLLVKDSIKSSNTIPHFQSHSFQASEGALKIEVDSLIEIMPIKKKVDYYSFFIVTDTARIKPAMKIFSKEHKKKPVFD